MPKGIGYGKTIKDTEPSKADISNGVFSDASKSLEAGDTYEAGNLTGVEIHGSVQPLANGGDTRKVEFNDEYAINLKKEFKKLGA